MLTADVTSAATSALQTQYQALNAMVSRLQSAIDYGLGDYGVVPADDVSDPTLAKISPSLIVRGDVVKWPRHEYDAWTRAWSFLTKQLGWFGPKAGFPLGTYYGGTFEDISLVLFHKPSINTAIEPAEDLVYEIELAFGPELGLTAPPKPPPDRTNGKTNGETAPNGEEQAEKKPLLSKWTIVGLVAAAAVGGTILYLLHGKDEDEDEEESAPKRAPRQPLKRAAAYPGEAAAHPYRARRPTPQRPAAGVQGYYRY